MTHRDDQIAAAAAALDEALASRDLWLDGLLRTLRRSWGAEHEIDEDH